MKERHLFEYAVIRVVPRVEREEFLNVGVVLYCRDLRYLSCLYHIATPKLNLLCETLDCHEVESHLLSFERICMAHPQGGPIAQLDLAARFRWLTATRSTIVQCSKVHPGFTEDPAASLDRLFKQLVL